MLLVWRPCSCVTLSRRLLSSVAASVPKNKPEDASTSSKLKTKWVTVVGLEIHAQIAAKSKLFSSAGTKFSAPPNSQVSPFDAGHPGTLPVLNKRCVEAGVLTALALNCQVNNISTFDRKHYFYADLPMGYQITQQRRPLAVSGYLEYPMVTGNAVTYGRTRITQVQLEQDSGKSLHDSDRSLVDLNRAGVGLMEIVCEPDQRSAAEAVAFVKELIRILKAVKTCDCKMEEGSLRVDVNVSVCEHGSPDLGVRTEVKNLSSLNSVTRAIEYESQRQISTLNNGGVIVNETRGFNDDAKVTVPMRDKEEKQDYRFMPEPNLPPLNLEAIGLDVERMKNRLPELPKDTRQRLIEKFGLKPVVAVGMVDQPYIPQFFNEVMAKSPVVDASKLANFLLIHVLAEAAEQELDDFRELPNLTDSNIGDLLYLVGEDMITLDSAGKIFKKMAKSDNRHPRDIADNDGLRLITDEKEVENLCLDIISKHPEKVAKAKAGKHRAFGALVSELGKAHGDRLHMANAAKMMQNLVNKIE